jgi:dihydrofolate synthase/folylpolyglutamate synthase
VPAFEYINPSSLDQRLEIMARRLSRGVYLDLEVEFRLMGLMGAPHQAYPCIHVAGTNGKGSVCAFLASILEEAGYRVGLYTSPHLVKFNERIQINRAPVSDDELVSVMMWIDELIGCETETLGRPATFFEYITGVAFEVFRRRAVDIAIIETGLGGRLDATNIVDPLVAVITSISMDHADYLGTSLAAIAGEKGGIIKKMRPVVVGCQVPEVLGVLERIAAERSCQLFNSNRDVNARLMSESLEGLDVHFQTTRQDYGIIRLPVLGRHQIENARSALMAVEVARDSGAISVSQVQIKRGIECMKWPARLQVIGESPLMLLDCAHNADAALKLADYVRTLAKSRPVGFIVGMCRDKDLAQFLQPFETIVSVCWPVTLQTERSLRQADLLEELGRHPWRICSLALRDALLDAQKWADQQNGIVCIAGSIYLAGEVLETLGKGPLNEQT